LAKGCGLRRILVLIDNFGGNHFTRVIMPARWADVVRALQLAAVVAFLGVASNQRIMRAAHVPLGTGDSVLRDSHVTTFLVGGHAPDLQRYSNDFQHGFLHKFCAKNSPR
jgi:hypothetical protein